MSYTIRKLTYSDGRAFRYHISDDVGNLRYIAERTGMFLPSPTYLLEFFDPDHNLSGRLQPPDVAPWQRGKHYEVFVGAAEEPYAAIQETWRLVDILLLRLPRYEVQLGAYRYIVQGSRYGGHFYEIFRPREKKETNEEQVDEGAGEDGEEETRAKGEMKVGQIQRPTVGFSYIVESDAAPLRQAPLVLASLVILIDMEMHS
ncbi:MAG: hypothetical protein DRI77_00815 [Chloroflexi bacterium]|nr:MAG: hypothetical protein DRI77_00815 [Chloroflexota bacterium]